MNYYDIFFTETSLVLLILILKSRCPSWLRYRTGKSIFVFKKLFGTIWNKPKHFEYIDYIETNNYFGKSFKYIIIHQDKRIKIWISVNLLEKLSQ